MHELIDMQNEPEVEDTLLTPEQRAYLNQFQERTMTPERAQWWECVRAQCNTIGARAALDWAMNDMELRQQNQTK